MSSAGQVLGGVTGAVIGFFASGGNPAGAIYGAQIGITAGGVIDPPKGPHLQGPRLVDQSVQTSTYGAAIPRGYGTFAAHGNVIWLENDRIREVSTTTEQSAGGKGGPTTTTTSYSYYATFAVGICQGPIAGFRRVWVGDKLIYDAGSDDLATIIASNEAAENLEFYLGTDTQEPDARIQADRGVANTPAYRGLAYIVFYDYPLADHGNTLLGAQVKAEVVDTETAAPAIHSWSGDGKNAMLRDGVIVSSVYASASGGKVKKTLYHRRIDGTLIDTETQSMATIDSDNGVGVYYCMNDTQIDAMRRNAAGGPNMSAWYKDGIQVARPVNPPLLTSAGVSNDYYAVNSNPVYLNGYVYICGGNTGDAQSWVARYPAPNKVPESRPDAYYDLYQDGLDSASCYLTTDGDYVYLWNAGGSPELYRFDAELNLDNTWSTTPFGEVPAIYGNRIFGQISANTYALYEFDDSSFTKISDDSVATGTVRMSHIGYGLAVHVNDIAGVVVMTDAPAGQDIALSDILESEALQSGLLSAGDIDATDLTDTVRGYLVSNTGALRASIETLRGAYPFDIVQSGYDIRFARRGRAIAAQYGAAGAIAYATGSSLSVAYPSGSGTGLVLLIGQKPATANGGGVTTPEGFELLGSLTGAGGYGATLGADTGNTNLYVYTREADGTESGSLAVALSDNNVSWGVMVRLSTTTNAPWEFAIATASDAAAGDVSLAFTDPGVRQGDIIIGGLCIPTDVTTPAQFSGYALAHTGVTYGTITEIGEPDNSGGNDIGGFVCYAAATAGESTGAPTLTATVGGTTTNVRGPGVFVRARTGYRVIPVEDLGAVSGSAEQVPQITIEREMDSQLPRQVVVKALDVNREYDILAQSDERQNTDAVNVLEVELPVVLTADEAKQKAQTLLYMYWLERYNVSFSLPPTHNDLEPGDVVTVETDDASYELRLTDIEYQASGVLNCRARYNDTAIYQSAALGEEGNTTGATLGLAGPTNYRLLDLPCMDEAMNAPGFMVAMCGYLAGWPGGVLYESADGGQSWTALQAITTGAPIGTATNALSAKPSTVIDASSVLNAFMSTDLESVTELQMLNGANHFAYGADGRWEIIAARTCVQQGDGSWNLSDMLRGRFGTEWAGAEHEVGDSLVLISGNGVAFVGVRSDEIGLERLYRCVTIGKSLDSDGDAEFTYAGNNLETLSPVYLNGNRHPSTNNWTLEWVRRTRIGGAWRDYVDASLGEDSESYEVEIYSSNTYTTLKRTITASSATCSYTSAQQVTDFGSNQSTLYVKVYQLSATVGRGYPLTTSITR